MSPALLVVLLIACLLALVPVWRLNVAGWSVRSLFTAWVLYTVGILVAVRFAAATRFLLPILVLAYVAPFVAGPERLARVFGGRRRSRRTVIDVTPAPAPALPEATEPVEAPDGGSPDDGSPDDDDLTGTSG